MDSAGEPTACLPMSSRMLKVAFMYFTISSVELALNGVICDLSGSGAPSWKSLGVLGAKTFDWDTLADRLGVDLERLISSLVPDADVVTVAFSYFDSLSAMPECEDDGGRQAPIVRVKVVWFEPDFCGTEPCVWLFRQEKVLNNHAIKFRGRVKRELGFMMVWGGGFTLCNEKPAFAGRSFF
jgi:hypothetical protein